MILITRFDEKGQDTGRDKVEAARGPPGPSLLFAVVLTGSQGGFRGAGGRRGPGEEGQALLSAFGKPLLESTDHFYRPRSTKSEISFLTKYELQVLYFYCPFSPSKAKDNQKNVTYS